MQPTLNFFAVVSLLGAGQALLLALALVTVRRGQRTRNLLLAAFTAIISVQVVWSVISVTHFYVYFPHLLRINQPFDFAVAPLFYLYVRSLTVRRPKLRKKELLHFVPAALCALYLVPYYLRDSAFKLDYQPTLQNVQWYYVRTSLVISLALVYMILAGVRVVRYLREAGKKSSAAERAAVFQLKFLIYYIFGLWLVAVVRYVFDLYNLRYLRYTNLILPLGATALVYTLAFFALRRSEAPSGDAEEDDAAPAKKYEKSALTPERSDAFVKRQR